MGNNVASFRGATKVVAALIILLGSLAVVSPFGGAVPGDLEAPVYSDDDWWNYTMSGRHYFPTEVGEYAVEIDQSSGWLKYGVDGTSNHLGKIAWELEVTGRLTMNGDWTGTGDSGSISMEATVEGTEWRSIDDLSYIGSSISYTGEMMVPTKVGPEYYNVTMWENRTLNKPMRFMLFPVPAATFPEEKHEVTVNVEYRTGPYVASHQETWDYMTSYRGLANIQGDTLTYPDQHRFQVVGNITIGTERTPFDRSVYYDSGGRKALTVDEVRHLEVFTYHVEQVQRQPDLIIVSSGFRISDPRPIEASEVVFTATIYNLGGTELRQVDVELWAAEEDELPSRINWTVIEAIEPIKSANATFNWTAESIGNWTFFVRVDPNNIVFEEREDNNEVIMDVEVTSFAPRPNLYIREDSISIQPESPLENRTAVEVSVRVHNSGPGDAWDVTVDMFLGKPGVGGRSIGLRRLIDVIPAGESRQTKMEWLADIPGPQTIWVYADLNNTVNESVETDNYNSFPIIIIASPFGGVDLVIVRVKMLDEFGQEVDQLPKGDRATIEVIISNEGPNNATRVHLSLYVDNETAGGLIGSFEDRINSKQAVTWTVNWLIDRENGVHNIIATVLALGEVEADFHDNIKSYEMKVGPRTEPPPEALDLTLFPDKNTLQPGETIEVSGKVTRVTNGFEVIGGQVEVVFVGQGDPVIAVTNDAGRYLAQIKAPSTPGMYRLEVTVTAGNSEGMTFVSISVQDEVVPNNGNGDDGKGPDWLFFVVAIIIILAVGMPLTYYLLLSKAAIRRRVRKVHEEIVEIVEADKK